MANPLKHYWAWVGRLRHTLAAWLRNSAHGGDSLNAAACGAIREQAEEHFHQSQTEVAIGLLTDLLVRLETEGLADREQLDIQRAETYHCLGCIYAADQRPEPAAQALQRAVTGYERLGEAHRAQLAATLDSLADVYFQSGRLDAALATAERKLAIYHSLEQHLKIAKTLHLIAGILIQQQHYAEAEARYADAFYAAHVAGDAGLKALTLQQQGSLKGRQDFHDQAIRLFKEAVALFRRAGDSEGEMQARNLLATAEVRHGQLDSAEENYTLSRILAEQLNDRAQLAINAQNVGILYQKRAEQTADPQTRQTLLRQAIALVEHSLTIKLDMNNQLGAEASYFQLGVMHWRLGDLEKAERYLTQATTLSESLNLSKVYKNYSVLARIAQDRGEAAKAAAWQAKCDAKVAELQQQQIQPDRSSLPRFFQP